MAFKVSSRSSKVVDFDINRKRLCDFLLVFNSNLGRILHHFGDTAGYRSKNRKNRPFEPTPLSQIALAGGDPLRISQLSAGYCHFGWLVSRVARHHSVRVDSVPSRKLGHARTRPRVFDDSYLTRS